MRPRLMTNLPALSVIGLGRQRRDKNYFRGEKKKYTGAKMYKAGV